MSLSAYRTAPLAVLIAAFVLSFFFSNTISRAFAQDSDFKWSFSEGNDPSNRGRLTARLGYGVPETDNAQVDGVCDARGGPANLILGADIGKLEEGSDVKVRFSGGGFEHTVTGIVFGTKIEEGITGVSLDVPVRDKLWDALTKQAQIDYQVPGYSSSRLKLKDGHSKIRQFIRVCRDYAQSSGADSATASKPADEKPDEQQKPSDAPAETALSEKDAFDNAKDLGTLEGWEAFLERFPDGFRADLARAYVKRLGGDSGQKVDAAKSATPETKNAETPPPPPPPPLPADISLAVTTQGSCKGGRNCSVMVTATNIGGEAFTAPLTIATSVAPGGASLQGTGVLPFSCEGLGGGAICSQGSATIAPGQSLSVPITFKLPRNAGRQVTTCTSIAWGGVPSGLGPREVQRKLNELGFNAGPADGQPGRKTVAAIRAFQQSAGISQTGQLDLPLYLALFSPGGAGDANPVNDQACAGAAVTQTIPLPAAYQGPVPSVCPRGQIVKSNGQCGCPSSVPVWTGTSCIPRLTRNCSRGRVYSKRQKLCVCPSSRPHWYNNRCHAQFDNCPGDSVRVGDRCLKENDPGFQARPTPAGPQLTGCPANTTRVGNSCVASNLAPLFSAFGKKPKGGQTNQTFTGSGNRPNPSQGGGQNQVKRPVKPALNKKTGIVCNTTFGEISVNGRCVCPSGQVRDTKSGFCSPPCSGGNVRVFGVCCPPGSSVARGQCCPSGRITNDGQCVGSAAKQLPPPVVKQVRPQNTGQKVCAPGERAANCSCPPGTVKDTASMTSSPCRPACGGGKVRIFGVCCPPGSAVASGRVCCPSGKIVQNASGKLVCAAPQQLQQNVACSGGGQVINGRCVCPASRPRLENGKCKKAKGSSKILQQLQQQQSQPQQQQPQQRPQQQQGPSPQQQQLQQGLQQLNKILSDSRLKRDIGYVTTRADGLKLYAFRYLWDNTAYVGVMAQDLLADPARASAVSLHESGYYMVDYAKLGLEMMTLGKWRVVGR